MIPNAVAVRGDRRWSGAQVGSALAGAKQRRPVERGFVVDWPLEDEVSQFISISADNTALSLRSFLL